MIAIHINILVLFVVYKYNAIKSRHFVYRITILDFICLFLLLFLSS